MLKAEEAWSRIASRLSPLEPISIPRQAARWRTLAAPVLATVDVPATDVSAMDGFAVAGSPVIGEQQPVAAVIAAGDPPGANLVAGGVARIMTGAPLPDGADRVVPIELTSAVEGSADLVVFHGTEEAGAHIRRRGEVVRSGSTLLAAGAINTPGCLGLLATHGVDEITVPRLPRVAIATTGNEVVPPEAVPGPGQLRDSHTDFLLAACDQLGIGAQRLGIVADDPEQLRATVEHGMSSDVLLLTGGVSMGAFDFVESTLEGLGCELIFDAVAIQPGKPMVAARHPRGWIFGLPGNPASAMVCFWLFVRPALHLLMGQHDGFWYGALEATLTAPLPPTKGRDVFLPGHARFAKDGSLSATPVLAKGSHDTSAYAHGSLLIRAPAASGPRAAGERCSVLPIVEWPESP